MAAIDKIYVKTYDEYLQFKNWCEIQSELEDKYGKKVKLTNYLRKDWKNKEDWGNITHPVMNNPYYVDAYIIRNCPLSKPYIVIGYIPKNTISYEDICGVIV